jgi:hypothetical protein
MTDVELSEQHKIAYQQVFELMLTPEIAQIQNTQDKLYWYYHKIAVLKAEHRGFDETMIETREFAKLDTLIQQGLILCKNSEADTEPMLRLLDAMVAFSHDFRQNQDVHIFLREQFARESLRYIALTVRWRDINYSLNYPKTLRLFALLAELASMLDAKVGTPQLDRFWNKEKIEFGKHFCHEPRGTRFREQVVDSIKC